MPTATNKVVIKNWIAHGILVVDIGRKEYTYTNVFGYEYEIVQRMIRRRWFGKAINFLKGLHEHL